MAEGGHLSKGSEEALDANCSPCLTEGISAKAKYYCLDCGVNYCDLCLKIHNRIPATQEHQVVDQLRPQTGSVRQALPVERCSTHHGKLIDMFCGDHETVCCSACVALNHRSCEKVAYLPDIAKGIKHSQRFKNVKDDIGLVLSKLKEQKTKLVENLSSLGQDNEQMNQEINEWEEELKAIVSKLAKNTREELYSQYAYSKKWLEQAIMTINNLITMLMSIEENIKDDNEVRVFAKVTEGKKVVEEGQTMLSNQSKYYRHVRLMFEIDDYLKNLGIMLSSLGLITTKYEEVRKENNQTQEYKLVRYRDYRINESCCTVSAVCALDDQTVLIFERTSTRLKRYSMRDIKVINQLQMNNCSHSICSLTSGEVAVAFNQKNKIQFVSVAGTTMTMTRSFTTVHGCWGVSFNKITGELCVSDGGSLVAVYNKTGQLMKTYQHDSTGRQLFTCSRNIAWSEDNTKLYVTDSKKGLIALDDSGTLLWVFTDPDLTSATGITVLPGDVILVSGLTSHNVLQVNKYGKRVGTAIGVRGCTCLNYPWALAFDRKSSILIVGHNKNIIQTYGLQICLKVNLK